MEFKLDNEAKKALLGLAPFSLTSTIGFVPNSYQIKKKEKDEDEGEYIIPEKYWPTIHIRPFTKLEGEQVKKALVQVAKDGNPKSLQESKELVRKIIKGFDNLIDVGAEEILEFEIDETGFLKKDIYDRFSDTLISDILKKCTNISGITDIERQGLKS